MNISARPAGKASARVRKRRPTWKNTPREKRCHPVLAFRKRAAQTLQQRATAPPPPPTPRGNPNLKRGRQYLKRGGPSARSPRGRGHYPCWCKRKSKTGWPNSVPPRLCARAEHCLHRISRRPCPDVAPRLQRRPRGRVDNVCSAPPCTTFAAHRRVQRFPRNPVYPCVQCLPPFPMYNVCRATPSTTFAAHPRVQRLPRNPVYNVCAGIPSTTCPAHPPATTKPGNPRCHCQNEVGPQGCRARFSDTTIGDTRLCETSSDARPPRQPPCFKYYNLQNGVCISAVFPVFLSHMPTHPA